MAGLFPSPKYDGVLGMWYGKAPGVDRTGDVFKHANFAGVGRTRGVLAIVGDDTTAKSSTLPSQSEAAFYNALMPKVYPSKVPPFCCGTYDLRKSLILSGCHLRPAREVLVAVCRHEKVMARRLRMIDNESGVVEITSRVQHGRFLLRPSPHSNDLILGVLGRAQSKYDVALYCFIFMSNHFHLLMKAASVRQMSRFVGFVKGNLAKELGRLHDWRENLWGRRYHSASVGASEEAQVARFSYILANGCKEGLVASPLEWPGVSSARALYSGENTLQGTWYDRTAQYRAQKHGEDRKVKLFPSAEIVHLSPLPFLAERSLDEQRAFVISAIRRLEDETAQKHRECGTAPIGVRSIRR